jgi:hypothetical protein
MLRVEEIEFGIVELFAPFRGRKWSFVVALRGSGAAYTAAL